MDKRAFTFNETYELDNVYNYDSDELYAGRDGVNSMMSGWATD